ncbi:hypothetical protein [Candidatus Binatus sp.]|uniref:hypothetical protein n=1 Tax=Candidatus Binatus sp. TaxID=2811406 RepID=UPI003BB04E8A
MPNKDIVEAQVQAEFAELERALDRANPGVAELLRAYGKDAEAARRVDFYLGIINPKPVVTTSDRSV